jgi:predicted adenine nucleotide alpha hydrolase (AANH) superfamily ATPase
VSCGSNASRSWAFFYGSNIHPYTECLRRRDTLTRYADEIDLKLIVSDTYDLEGFLRNAAFREKDRCSFCYHDRLRTTALIAKRGKFDSFSTTLLYSKFQRHDRIQSIGRAVAKEVDLPFTMKIFDAAGKKASRSPRQKRCTVSKYCGCIYSEKERYFR